MAVQYIGKLGDEEQKVNPYVEMLMKFGTQSALQEQEIAGKKEIAKTAGEAEAKTLLARTAIEREDTTRKNLTATWQSLSDKPVNERNLFVETDHGKEYLKVVKDHLPELFDANGSPIFFPSTKDQIKQQLDAQISKVKSKLLATGPDALTEGERSILQMEGMKDEISEVTFRVISNPAFATATPQEQMAMVKQGMDLLKSQRGTPMKVNDFAGALGGDRTPLFYGPTAQFPGVGEMPVAEQARPGAARFKVRRIK